MSESTRPKKRPIREVERSLGEDPLSTDGVLAERFYQNGPRAEPKKKPSKPKPDHYKVVSISLYTEDIEKLEAMVAELKRRGHSKANKSQLIRFALDMVDLDALPRSY